MEKLLYALMAIFGFLFGSIAVLFTILVWVTFAATVWVVWHFLETGTLPFG